MLLVNRLTAGAERFGDFLPRPSLFARVAHLECLEALEELSQRDDSPESDRRILAGGVGCEFEGLAHGVILG